MLNQLIQSYSNEIATRFLQTKISTFKPDIEDFDLYLKEKDLSQFSQLRKLGEARFGEHDELLAFSCKYDGELTERSSKKRQFEIARKVLKEDFKDGAIFIFYDDHGRFRFSFIRKNYGDQDEKYTPWRRYTYFVDPARQNKTFRKRIGEGNLISLDVIQESFSVEPLSKQFYKDLSYWYFWSIGEVEFPNDTKEDTQALHANAMIRLITRLMFVWFMKQKQLIPDDFFDKAKLKELIDYKDSRSSTYYKAILQNLFFATLNVPREKGRKFVNRQWGVQGFFRYERFIKNKDRFFELMDGVPFLNGGLFECLDMVDAENKTEVRIDCFSDPKKNEGRLCVPDYLFFGKATANINAYLGEGHDKVDVEGLIDILNRYDFTIDENTPYDQEVALDPELLGMVFENLLASFNPETQSAARKESGSFYTPRTIVDFMVDEALIHYLNSKTKFSFEKLKTLFSANSEQPFDKQTERETIVNLLTDIKIIDPACGSGAFPMGALQKMVHVLGKIDHDNKILYERQKEIAIEDTKAAYEIGDEEERHNRLDAIERAYDSALNEPDYARKLFLIENCLYGVDIQPIAMQISKLRFFISLLVDQKLDEKEENFGILALPNLETKFVAANSLIHLPGTSKKQYSIRDHRIEDLEKELAQVRHELFNARTTKTKEKRRKRHREIQDEIGEVLVDLGFPNAMAEAIKDWKAFNPNSRSNWFDAEWMFGHREFDVVLGNPPYIQLQKAFPGSDKLKYADLYKDEGYQNFARTGDIYMLFYEHGINLLKAGGILCYITSNKWMRTHYGEVIRKYFASKKPLYLIDLGPGIFEAATVDTNVLVIENSKTEEHKMTALTLRSQNQISAIRAEDTVTLTTLSGDTWVILDDSEMSLKRKIEAKGKPLGEWDITINYGIKTGYNPAFIVNGKTKDALIKADPRSRELLKPLLRGKDIKRYQADFKDLWLLFIPWHFPLHEDQSIRGYSKKAEMKFKEEYPVVYGYLHEHIDSLSKRNQAETGIRYEWYALQRCAATYWKDFEKEKIIYPNMTKYLPFIFDKDGYFINDKAFIMTGKHLKYLACYLNSTLSHYIIRQSFPELQGGTRELRKVFMVHVPVIEVPPLIEKVFDVKLYNLLELIEKGKSTQAIEQEIDLMVYKLYDLSWEEVRVIDAEPPFSRVEYEKFNLKS